jgi:hypothetical protein
LRRGALISGRRISDDGMTPRACGAISDLGSCRPHLGERLLILRCGALIWGRRILDDGAAPRACGAISELGSWSPELAAGFLSLGSAAVISRAAAVISDMAPPSWGTPPSSQMRLPHPGECRREPVYGAFISDSSLEGSRPGAAGKGTCRANRWEGAAAQPCSTPPPLYKIGKGAVQKRSPVPATTGPKAAKLLRLSRGRFYSLLRQHGLPGRDGRCTPYESSPIALSMSPWTPATVSRSNASRRASTRTVRCLAGA